jgi:hypothetical protein
VYWLFADAWYGLRGSASRQMEIMERALHGQPVSGWAPSRILELTRGRPERARLRQLGERRLRLWAEGMLSHIERFERNRGRPPHGLLVEADNVLRVVTLVTAAHSDGSEIEWVSRICQRAMDIVPSEHPMGREIRSVAGRWALEARRVTGDPALAPLLRLTPEN